jgi:hypothetical protein
MIGLRIAGSFLRRAICEIREENRYRYYPLYSAILAGLVYVWFIWPWDNCVWIVFRENPGMLELNYLVVDVVCTMMVCCGIVGLFRRGMAPKILSGVGLYAAVWWWETFDLMYGLPSYILYYVFDVPEKYISGIAGLETGGATLLWCGYLMTVYLLLRPLLVRVYRGIESFARRSIDRYPLLERLDKPVL